MTGALAMTLPALLCGVVAWDLSRPATPRAAPPSSRPSGTPCAVGALLGDCGAAALSGAWLPTSATSVVLATFLGAVAVALTAVAATGHRRRLPVPASSPGGLAAVPAELA